MVRADTLQPLPFMTRYLPVAALLFPILLLLVIGWLNWNSVWRTAEDEMQRAATSVAEYGRQSLRSYSAAAGRLNDRLRGLSDAEIRASEGELHRDLQRLDSEVSRVEQAYVIDRAGRPLLSSGLYPVPRDGDLSNRDFFQAMQADAPPEAYVSKTFIGRFDGHLLFSVARGRQDTGNGLAPGAFDGVVVVSISPENLADGLRRLSPDMTDRMALVRQDGHVITTTSAITRPDEPLPQVDPASPFYDHAGRNVETAVYVSNTALPGSAALIAIRKIDGFPVYAVSIRPQSEITAAWWKSMIPYLAFKLPASAALFLLSLRVVRDQRQLAQRAVSLANVAHLSADRLGRAKRFGMIGTFEFDLRTGVSRRSPEYMSLHGLPAVATEETHDDWEKRLYPDDTARAMEELNWALSDESGAEDYGQSYRIVTRDGDVRWIAARGVIRRDENGKATLLLGVHTDVTPLRSSEIALAESDARLRLAHDATGIGTWEWVPKSRRLSCSNRMMEIFGFDPADGIPRLSQLLGRVHPEDRQMVRDHLRAISQTSRFQCEFRVRRPSDSQDSAEVWVSARAALVSLAEKASPQVMGIVLDISDRKQAETMVRLIANEVEHRAKNTLALISAMLRMTKADSASELARLMQGRISALGSTMGILRKSQWQGADLADILTEAVAFFLPQGQVPGNRVRLTGPPVQIPVEAAQPVSLAVHELATNAAKYGALSSPAGSLAISWQVMANELHIEWSETGGPAIASAPQEAGFGSKLMVTLLEGQLGGRVTKEWRPSGLLCRISFRLHAAEARHVA